MDVVGREAELAALDQFLDGVSAGPSAFLIEGEPGIGKTTVWRAGLDAAAERRLRVLSCWPVESEATMSYAGLGDLLQGVLEEVLPSLPAPQRRALNVALFNEEAQEPLAEGAVERALLGALRLLAHDGPVVVAVDDVQWLDVASARTLKFAVRRLEAEPIGLILSVRIRSGERDPLGVVTHLQDDRLHRLRLAPLSAGALDQMLRARLPIGFPRPMLLKLHRASGGNPLFALEMARTLLEQGTSAAPSDPFPVPDDLRDVVRARLAALTPSARSVLPAIAALTRASPSMVAAATGPEAAAGLSEAVADGVIEIDGDRLRFTHPLLASVVYADAGEVAIRTLHGRLAEIVAEPEQRSRHLALAASGPSVEVAASLDAAAAIARARGAPAAAAELCELASLLTPADQGTEIRRRLVNAADHHFASGDMGRARRHLELVAPQMAPGRDRARVLRLLGLVRHHSDSVTAAADLAEQALAECGDDLALRVDLELDLAATASLTADFARVGAHAQAALELAEGLDDDAALAEALMLVAFSGSASGESMRPELLERFEALEGDAAVPLLLRGPTLYWRYAMIGEKKPAEARSELAALRARMEIEGNDRVLPIVLLHLSGVEWALGEWDLAASYAQRACSLTLQTEQEPYRALALHFKALIDAGRGRVAEARAAASEGLMLSASTGVLAATALHLSVLAFIELSLGDHGEAHRLLSPVVEVLEATGFSEPAANPWLCDDVEALIGLGNLARARELLDPFEERSRALGRELQMALAGRCRGLLLAAEGDLDGSLQALERAVQEHTTVTDRLELVRTLVVQGMVRRRAKQKRGAREALDRALEIAERLGATLWADNARAQLARIGGRVSTPHELSETERRVAELASAGRTNSEIAEALFISVKSVESNLTRVYRKLDVRSRRQLPVALATYHQN